MKPRCQSFWFASSLSLFWLATTSPLAAQVVPDTTLSNPSVVTPNGNTSIITGGTQAGANLFHSFGEFSVPTNGVASFQQIDQGIENVISRVTGLSISNINGLVEVLQTNGTVSPATFFLLNPNGIIFGPNASLNVGGSFIASTASSLLFADGTSFSATNPQTTAPLLTVSVPIGLQYGSSAGNIQVQGAALQVPFENTLGLVGGDLTLVGGRLVAAGGRIELGSVAGAPDLTPVQVSLTPTDKGWALGYQGVENFQDIQLSQTVRVNASGLGAGDIQVQGRRVTLTDGSQIFTTTGGAGIGGTLAVTASESVEISGTAIYGLVPSGLFADVAPDATGSGANLTITTGQLLVQGGAAISASTLGSGNGGNLTVQATESVIVTGTDDTPQKFGSSLRATVEAGATGEGGNLTIDTPQLIVRDGAQVLTSTFGEGNAGKLTVQNATDVELVGGVVVDGEFVSSGLFSQTETTGDGGDLLVSAERLIVTDGAQVSATTIGSGKAGDVTVQASDVELVGVALSPDGQFIADDRGLSFPSGLLAGTEIGSTGAGGTLTVETNRLSLREGAVLQTSALSSGDAGDLIVEAESVEVIGTFADSRFPTSLLTVSGGIPDIPIGGVVEATGKGGNLSLTTGELIVQDGGLVAVSSLNPNLDAKGAGDLQITADTITLDNQGQLTAATASGDGGNMNLQVQDLLLLRRESDITTTAGIEGAGGNGGNITLNAPDGFIAAVFSENSDITANAFTGNGGNIQITIQGIFGIQFQEDLTPESDITASSQFGIDGVVVIDTPGIDPSRGLVALPTGLVDASRLIASGCGSQKIAQSQFIVTGRGGLPPNPSEPLRSNTIWNDLRPTTVQAQNLPSATVATSPTSPTKGQLVEAQGWVIGPDGEVILTAEAPIACAR